MINKLCLLLFVVVFIGTSQAETVNVKAVRQAIQQASADWQVTENRFTRMSLQERQRYLGSLEPDFPAQSVSTLDLYNEALPESLDWRSRDGNWVTPVRDQGECGSCWAFSAIAQVESYYLLKNGTPNFDLDLSEQYLVSCTDAGDCEQGGYTYRAIEHMMTTGAPLESCYPYKGKTNLDCGAICDDWDPGQYRVPDWGWITFGDANQVENIKAALMFHPVSISYTVYADFYGYSGGVYEHVTGDAEGGHAVTVVGWNDAEQSWICKNSWGADWGEDGYFRIKWGDSNMGRYVAFIFDETVAENQLFASRGQVVSSVTYGDTLIETFDLVNMGDEPVQYYVREYVDDEEIPDWLTVRGSAGILWPSEPRQLELEIVTRELEPGRSYERVLDILANSRDAESIGLPVRITVERPPLELALQSMLLPEQDFQLFKEQPLSVELLNLGQAEFNDFDVICELERDSLIYADTVHVDQHSPDQPLAVSFKPFRPRYPGTVHAQVRLANHDGDHNAFNDAVSDSFIVSNLLESFEGHADDWTFSGGWLPSKTVNGHDGFQSAHCHGGVYPYGPNLNAVLTYEPGFDLTFVDSLFVTFWERHFFGDAGDMGLVQISGDKSTWETVTEFSGRQVAWKQHVIDFNPQKTAGWERAWLRFVFTSNDSLGGIGWLVDNVSAWLSDPGVNGEVNIPSGVEDSAQPTEFSISNAPNPFNSATTIQFSLPQTAQIRLDIYNMYGQQVQTLLHGVQSAGEHHISWDGNRFASGVYVAVLHGQAADGGSILQRQKMLMVK